MLVLLLAPLLALAQQLAAVPPLDGPVVDTTMTLSAPVKQALVAQALALKQRKGSQLQVLVVPTTQPEDIAQYATRAFDQYKLGRGEVNDGVLLVVAKDDRRARVEVGYGLEGAIPDATAARVIQEYLLPRFRAGDFDGGVTESTAALVRLVDGEMLPPPMVETRARPQQGPLGGETWVFALFAALIAAQVLRGVLGRVPGVIRGPLIGLACGVLAWLVSAKVLLAGFGLIIGLVVGSVARRAGRFSRNAGFGGFGGGMGGWGGGGGMGGGGWSGGGGMSGGGGASGSW